MSMTQLDSILKKTQDKPLPSLLPDELSYLITAFLPTQPTEYRSKAYLILSAFCQGVRGSVSPNSNSEHSEAATQALVNVLAPSVVSRLGDVEEEAVLVGISFLVALFWVDRESASSIFLRDGVAESVADSVDLFPSSSNLALEISHLLGQAGTDKSCSAVISTQSLHWLQVKSRQTNDLPLQAAATVALVKLSRRRGSDDPSPTSNDRVNEGEFSKLLKRVVVDGTDQSSLTDAIEGLAYLSVDPLVKEDLSRDNTFLSRMVSIAPRRTRPLLRPGVNSTLLYGVVTIISNICMYRPRLNDEQVQIERLKRMAQAAKRTPSVSEESRSLEAEDNDHCMLRARRLVACGVIDVLTSAVSMSDSRGVRLTAGKALLSIIEDKENRGKVLQAGGAKTLRLIIGQFLSTTSPAFIQPHPMDTEELVAIQALAKLAITSSPLHVFGPNHNAMFDAIRPFTLMLLHASSTLLQRFEAMMALTNLASENPEVASRIAATDNLMSRVEYFLLEDHTLIRRAAMELICNLIAGSDQVFERYCGVERMSGSKLLVVLALCDVDDLPTKLAASGALATLTTAPTACLALLNIQHDRHRVLHILTQLIDPNLSLPSDKNEHVNAESHPGLTHRGIICARNFLLSLEDPAVRKEILAEAKSTGLADALAKVARDEAANDIVSTPALEALKWLADSGKG